MDSLKKYILAFQRLRIDRAHGIAPHKPILLLSVLQAYQNNLINSCKIYITPEIVALFKSNWNNLVRSNHDCRFALPFYHLTSDLFWKIIPKTGFENILHLKTSMRSFANLNLAVDHVVIDDDLFVLMRDNQCNNILKQLLLDEYFPNTKENFSNSTEEQRKIFDDIQEKILNEDAVEYRNEIKTLMQQKDEEEIFLRSSLFKREIPRIYKNTCCISEMKIDAIVTLSMIDACHIVPFSESYDDTITNGIALCPNIHRAFDRGLISIDKHFCVIVQSNFIESNNSIYQLKIFSGKRIILPDSKLHYPLLNNFYQHRKRFNFE